MSVESVLGNLEDSMSAKRVFSEPIEKDGATIILAAKIGGGGGGGEGKTDQGAGLGFGLGAKPAGAFIIQKGRVRWRPALDLNRVIMGGQIVAFSAFLFLRALAQRRTVRLVARRGLFGRRLRLA